MNEDTRLNAVERIANELREANRLKRIELKLRCDPDQHKVGSLLKEIDGYTHYARRLRRRSDEGRSMRGELVTTHGYNGWGNRKNGCEAYGPGGRWEHHPERSTGGENGDLLGDHLDSLGCHEGSPFIVIASTSRFDEQVIRELLDDRHCIEFKQEGWTIQHPLRERCDGSLFECRYRWDDMHPGTVGRFVLEWDEEADDVVLGDRIEDA